MNKRGISKLLIASIIILILLALAVILFAFYIPEKETNQTQQTACQNLGCPSDTIYVGSINSDKYYTCDCHYADTINQENIICFSSDSDATSQNYLKSAC